MLEVEKTSDELTLEEIVALAHIYIGPTWMKDADDGWWLPEYTLGWEIAGWCAQYLRAQGGGPWKFTKEQLRFVLWWYAIDDTGRFKYRTGVLQRMKGWGKDPLLAVLCLVEMAGPCRFSHWNIETGEPIAMPQVDAWVQITAVNQSQTENTMGMMPSLMSDEFIATYGVKAGATLIRALEGKVKIQAVTSSYRAIEGKRTTFTVLNETHHWVSGNKGIKMYETIDGNSTKMDSRYLSITNAYLPGEDSVAEKQRDAYNAIVEGRAADIGFMYDSIEANPLTPLSEEALKIVVPIIRGDAVWLRVETIIQSIQNLTIAASRSRRMYLNQIVAEEDALYGTAQWDPLEVKGAKLKAGDEVTLGFDGGKSDDSTALVAIRISDNVAFVLGVWEKPPSMAADKRWLVPRDQVDSAVHDAFRVLTVRGFYADVAEWQSYIAEWENDYAEGLGIKASVASPIGYDMRQALQKVTRMHERLMQTIFDSKLGHDGDLALRRHVLNARRRSNNYGISFGKESRESPRKVDLYAALMLAHEAAHDFRTRGKVEPVRSTRGYFL